MRRLGWAGTVVILGVLALAVVAGMEVPGEARQGALGIWQAVVSVWRGGIDRGSDAVAWAHTRGDAVRSGVIAMAAWALVVWRVPQARSTGAAVVITGLLAAGLWLALYGPVR